MKANAGAVTTAVVALVVVLLLGGGAAVEAVLTCSPVQLSPCASAITSSSLPTRLCCQRIRQQIPCLCGYLKNPTLKKFINTPNARKVATTCKVSIPKC